MRSILVLNDNSAAAEHAAMFAVELAIATQADLIVANIARPTTACKNAGKAAGNGSRAERPGSVYKERLGLILRSENDYVPMVEEVNAWDLSESELSTFARKENILYVVQGVGNEESGLLRKQSIDIRTLLNTLSCPLIAVPLKWPLKAIRKMAYLADLRYCRTHVVRMLSAFGKPFKAMVTIAHVAAKGLPPLDAQFAANIFSREIKKRVNDEGLALCNIAHRDLPYVIDLLTRCLRHDLVVMANNRFHFDTLFNDKLNKGSHYRLQIPMMIVPS